MMQDLDMLLLVLSTFLLVTLILSFYLRTFYKTLKKEHKNSSKNNLPPGRMGWPLLGETLEFLSMGRKGSPENFFTKRMEKYSADVFKTSLIGEKTAVLCGPSGHKFLYSNENKLVTSWWPSNVEKIFPTSLQTSTKEESKKMRKLLPGFLKADSLVKYISVMDSIAAKHLETHWEFKDEVTVLPLAKQYTFAVASRLFLSIDNPEKIARFEKPFEALVAGVLSVPIDLIGTPFNRAIKAADVIRRELLEVIRQRRREQQQQQQQPEQPCNNDILAHMLTTTDDEGKFMSELDIADKIIGLLIGGHDTASGAITFIVKYLAESPQVYERVLAEQNEVAKSKTDGELLNWEDLQKMKYSWNVACEALRLAPPLQGSFREAIADFSYAGYFIPKGWKLYWTANTTHKNPEYFPDPERFDPSRFEGNGPIPYTYVPFGGGPRMCPGKEYARLEILAFMYNVVRKYRWEKIIPEEEMIVDPMPMPRNGLPIRLYKN